MKTIFTIIMFCGFMSGYAQNTPPNAASTIIWVIGEQSWSAAIRMPECHKETFKDSDTEPDCRSYTEEGKTWYYYNWAYVNEYKAKMCPSPWRVPTMEDFKKLVSNTNNTTLVDAWGYGGYAAMSDVSSHAYYWSSTETSSGSNFAYYLNYYSSNTNDAYNLRYYSDSLGVANNYKYLGFQVRCVK
jgi:hypothetical protein